MLQRQYLLRRRPSHGDEEWSVAAVAAAKDSWQQLLQAKEAQCGPQNLHYKSAAINQPTQEGRAYNKEHEDFHHQGFNLDRYKLG